MSRGRKTEARRKVRCRVDIYEDIYTPIALLYFDPLRGKIKYGALTDLVNQLLTEHLKQFKSTTTETQPKPENDNESI